MIERGSIPECNADSGPLNVDSDLISYNVIGAGVRTLIPYPAAGTLAAVSMCQAAVRRQSNSMNAERAKTPECPMMRLGCSSVHIAVCYPLPEVYFVIAASITVTPKTGNCRNGGCEKRARI